VCHRTVSGVPPDSVRWTRVDRLQTLHLRVSGEPLRYNSPDCPVCQRSNGSSATVDSNGHLQKRYNARTVRAESEQRLKVHRTVNSACPVRHRTVRCGTGLSGAPRCQSSNGRNRQNPNGWVTWLAHRIVRCAHRQTVSPTAGLVVGAINTPQPLPLKASKFFRHLIQYKS
jgi:hypothetical protein